ncbi:hypothetical protein I308_105834 [Cryptococcus tetragattii IND107]|uniref:Uncharacterized protein n=1 Tax=Cryptococcus tetragattii IND107 TaxID=1296105 RepID=A0ABR3BK97_9TREE
MKDDEEILTFPFYSSDCLVISSLVVDNLINLNPSSYLSNLSASPLNIVRTLPQSCSVSSIPVPLDGQSNLAVSDGEVSSMIAVGRGIQNYTCTSRAYVSTGALANLFDVTCLYALTAGSIDPSVINSILPKMMFVALDYPNTDDLSVAIHHLFVDTPGSTSAGSISPEFVTDTDRVLPPSSCTTENEEISVQYASMYWFTK